MSSHTPLKNKRLLSIVVILAVLVIALSSYVVLYKVPTGFAAQPSFLNVDVSGPSEIGVNKPSTYTASVNNSFSNSLEYTWTVSPVDNKTLFVPMGKTCNLTFVEATTDRYVISVQVQDRVVGNLGSGSHTVFDPYTSPTQYLGSVGLPYSYLIQTDGLGWYRAIKGADNSVSYSSTNASYIINTILPTLGSLLPASEPFYDTLYLQGTIIVDSPIIINTLFVKIIFDTIISTSTTQPVFSFERTNGHNVAYSILQGGYIGVPSNYNSTAILLHDTTLVNLKVNSIMNLGTVDSGSVGIKLLADKLDSGYTSYSSNNNVEAETISGFYTGVLLQADNQWCNVNFIKVSAIGGATYGIKMNANGGNVHSNTISSTMVTAPLLYSFWANDRQNSFIDCSSVDNVAHGDYYLNSGAVYTRIIGGIVSGASGLTIDSNALAFLTASGVTNFNTKVSSSFSVTGTVNSKYVAYGLTFPVGDTAPYAIHVTAEQNGQGDYCVSSFNSTGFTIIFVNQPNTQYWYFFYTASLTQYS